jgi:putative flippase GtrA
MAKLKIEVTKFTIVGSINFALTFLIFFILVKLINVNYLVSLTLVWAVGIFFSYLLNFLWVFKPEQRLQFKERFVKYYLSYLLSFALNFSALSHITEYTGFDPFYAQAILTPFIVVFNFSTTKYWSLRPSGNKL